MPEVERVDTDDESPADYGGDKEEYVITIPTP